MWRLGNLDIAENLDELVTPAHCALLMWDFARGLATRAFNAEQFIGNTQKLLEVARSSGVSVFYSQQSDMKWEDIGPGLIRMRMKQLNVKTLAGHVSSNRKGTPGGDFVEPLRPLDGDVIFEKFLPNAFLGTNLEWRLRSRGIKTLVLAGISVETGVEGTAREAINRGFYAVIARDCVSTTGRDKYDLAMPLIERLFDVFGCEEIAEIWRRDSQRTSDK